MCIADERERETNLILFVKYVLPSSFHCLMHTIHDKAINTLLREHAVQGEHSLEYTLDLSKLSQN